MLGLPWDWQSPNGVPGAMSCSFCPVAGECLGSDEQIFIPKVLWTLPALAMAGQLHPWRWTWLKPLRTDCPFVTHQHYMCVQWQQQELTALIDLVSSTATDQLVLNQSESFVQELLQMGLVTRQADCSSCLWLKLDFQQIQIIWKLHLNIPVQTVHLSVLHTAALGLLVRRFNHSDDDFS